MLRFITYTLDDHMSWCKVGLRIVVSTQDVTPETKELVIDYGEGATKREGQEASEVLPI